MKKWLKRFFKSQVRIEELEEELEAEKRARQTVSNQLRSCEEGKQSLTRQNQTLQERVNRYFFENEFLWKQIPASDRSRLAKQFQENERKFLLGEK